MAFSPRFRQLYFADARISTGLTDDSQFNHAGEGSATAAARRTHATRAAAARSLRRAPSWAVRACSPVLCLPHLPVSAPPPGRNAIRLPPNRCGGLFAIDLDESFNGYQAKVIGRVRW